MLTLVRQFPTVEANGTQSFTDRDISTEPEEQSLPATYQEEARGHVQAAQRPFGRAPKSGMTITFTVNGVPKPAGSKRAFAIRKRGVFTGRVAVTDANPLAREWKDSVTSAGVDAAQKLPGGLLLTGALAVDFTFFLPRPKGHYGSGKNASQVKGNAPEYPTGKPDVLKLTRAAEDALTGVLWQDDAQIVSEHLNKQYGHPPRVVITVTEL